MCMKKTFTPPNEIAMLAAALNYKTGVDKLSDQKSYREYLKIAQDFRNDYCIFEPDYGKVKAAIQQFVEEMDKKTLQSILTKLQ